MISIYPHGLVSQRSKWKALGYLAEARFFRSAGLKSSEWECVKQVKRFLRKAKREATHA